MKNVRIYIEKKASYDIHSQSIREKIKHIYEPAHLQLFIVYDVYHVDDEGLRILEDGILADPITDVVHHHQPEGSTCIAWEYLPGQYDQRAEAAEQCLLLHALPYRTQIKSAYLLLLSEDAEPYHVALKKYLINPVDSQEKELNTILSQPESVLHPIEKIGGFLSSTASDLEAFIKKYKLSISLEDIALIQKHFIQEQREPTLTEIKIIDTYWSDHCRHTTFLTHIEQFSVASEFKEMIEGAWRDYLNLKQELGEQTKPVSLMDMATIVAKYLKRTGKLTVVEDSEENNACSINIKIDTDKGEEDWLLLFKNETHNHPTEIDPYGGASTCIGGAIRDPLSGRAYVYQAMRISGAANPLDKNTLPNKLPQKKICQEAAQGFAGYGNQIGLTTSHVTELYHEGYKAKRMEVGLVVGAVPQKYVRRESPQAGDVVFLLGGRTGKDGIGGASGSSKVMKKNVSSNELSAEVQKGNAPLERMLQRLFRNPEFLSYIKKSNDFGAGGVAVAIGELARGICVYLDHVPLKYSGLNGLEIAISESQERMAIVCEAKDATRITELADSENVEATLVAKITDDDTLRMMWKEEEIVHLKRNFLDTNGATRYSNATYCDGQEPNPFLKNDPFSPQSFLEKLSSLTHCSQVGLINQFDNSIGKRTVVAPLGGKYQKTKEDVGIQQIPYDGDTNTCSAVAYGYVPHFAMWSTFHAGIYAVVESATKLICAGVALKDIHLSFQEYFERLENKTEKWGKPVGALLGALQAQHKLGIAAIGGKDSMSGSYDNIHVPPTLISFAVGIVPKVYACPSTLPEKKTWIYLAKTKIDPRTFVPEWHSLLEVYELVQRLHQEKKIIAAKAISHAGIAIDLSNMAWGNKVGLFVEYDELVEPFIGSVLVASEKPLTENHLIPIGHTTHENTFVFNTHSIPIDQAMRAWEQTLHPIYPNTHPQHQECHPIEIPLWTTQRHLLKNKQGIIAPRVCIPVFAGTNCEYDTALSFTEEGANVQTAVFKTRDKIQIQDSVEHLRKEIERSEILCFAGGFSYADEPDGSAKYIASIIRHPRIHDSIQSLLQRGGLILGICNGFQALIKSGLLPYHIHHKTATLSHNLIARHVASIVQIKITSALSPWINTNEVGESYLIPISHGEGRLVLPEEDIKTLADKGQIISQYVEDNKTPSMTFPYNPNGSDFAIESLADPTGNIYGRMAHPERYRQGLFKNIPHMSYHNIFKNGVTYFQ